MTLEQAEAGAGIEASAPARQRSGILALVRHHPVLISGAAYILLVFNFSIFQLGGTDELVQYGFVQRLFGDSPVGSGYLFGLSILETPFYAFGKLLGTLGLHSAGGHPITKVTLAVALGAATLAIWALLAPVLRGLELRRPGTALFTAAIGMPLLYYATVQPTKSHGLEAVLSAAAIYLAFRLFRGDGSERWLPFVLGADLGLVCTVRYFDGSEGIALVIVLLCLRRVRDAVVVSIGGIVTAGLLLLVPLSLGASLVVTEASTTGTLKGKGVPISFVPATPIRMLFTNERGLFLWSPISVLAIVGLVLLYRSRPRDRHFLIAAYAMGASIVLVYMLTPWWTGSLAFSQRFFTALTPIVALGVAGALDRRPRLGTVVATLCAGWTFFLMMNFISLGGPPLVPGGAWGSARTPARMHVSVGAYLWGVRYKCNFLRWTTR